MQQWTSVYILLDEGSPVPFYPFVAGVTESTLKKKNIQTVKVIYSSKMGRFDFGPTLERFSQQSRSETIFF